MLDYKYALRRQLQGYNKCIVWRLDKDNKFIESLEGYIDYRCNTVKVYKDHRKVDVVALMAMVPMRLVQGLSDSQRAALIHDGRLQA